MAENLYVPQIDYTSRDFTAIRDDLISLIPNFAPQWTSRDATDFGIVLLELFSYVGDSLNYYIDRAANEGFIDTATQRETVVKLARLLGYTPNSINPATGQVTFTNYLTEELTVPAGTQVATTSNGEQIIFETTAELVIAAAPDALNPVSGTVDVVQGQTVSNEFVGESDGTANQKYRLTEPFVVTDPLLPYLQVFVGEDLYANVDSLLSYGADNVYTTETDSEGFSYIVFGDGVYGSIPPSGNSINVTYRVSQGSAGNVPAGSVTNIVNGTVTALVTNNEAMGGGADAESTDTIREAAPKALRALNRAVSIEDYEAIALQVPGVGKAKAASSSYSAITLYIAAASGSALTPALSTSIEDYFNGKTPPGTRINIIDAFKVYPDIRLTINVSKQASASAVKSLVLGKLYDLLAFDNVTLNDIITEADIILTALSVSGVTSVSVTGLSKKTTTTDTAVPTTKTDIYCTVAEYPALNEDFIDVQTIGGSL